MIKDSGNRRQFDTGAVRDMQEGKGRMDLLPWAAVMEVSKHCEAGAKKYGEQNVDKGIPLHSLCDSAARHLAKFMDGWTDEPHLLAAAWNLLWAIQMQIKHPELCDLPVEEKGEKMAQPADVVKVVRCKDCVSFVGDECRNRQWEDYEGNNPYVKEDDFCSYGERGDTE